MSFLLVALLCNAVILMVLLGGQVWARTHAHGVRYALSNFDVQESETSLERRLSRARTNQLEALVLLIPVVVLAIPSPPHDAARVLQAAAATHVAGRIAYVVMHLAGVPYLRSATWLVSFVAWGVLIATVGTTLG